MRANEGIVSVFVAHFPSLSKRKIVERALDCRGYSVFLGLGGKVHRGKGFRRR